MTALDHSEFTTHDHSGEEEKLWPTENNVSQGKPVMPNPQPKEPSQVEELPH